MSHLIKIALLFGLLSAVGCVSVSLAPHEAKRAKDLQVTPPDRPFESINSRAGDAAWKNQNTGSIISYLSDCSDGSDPSLANLRDEILRGLENVKVQSEENLIYQNRKALRTYVLGEVDGITSSVDLLVLKKNSCSFVISFVSSPEGFQRDRQAFGLFLKRFEIP